MTFVGGSLIVAMFSHSYENRCSSDGMGINFVPGNSTAPYFLNIINDTAFDGTGITQVVATDANGYLRRATIKSNPNYKFLACSCLAFDPAKPGFATIWPKHYRHEIGHTLGLAHPDFPTEAEQP